MNVKSLIAVLLISVVGNYALAAPCEAPPVTLEDNQWKIISLPCNPERPDSVTGVFGGSLDPGTYGKKWVVYSFKGPGYEKLLPSEPLHFLEQGRGYWIIQVTGGPVQLEMPVQATATTNVRCSKTDPNECFNTKTLRTDSGGGIGWNMLGNPYKVEFPVKMLRIELTNPPEGTPPAAPGDFGFTLPVAHGKEIFHNEIFRYNGASYVGLKGDEDSVDMLSPWEGFWGATRSQAHSTSPRLRFTN